MRMWLSCVVLLSAAYIVEPVPADTKLISITRTSLTWTPESDAITDEVLLTCYGLDSDVAASVTSSTLAIGRTAVGSHEKTFYEHSKKDTVNIAEHNCKYFDAEIPSSYMGKEVKFILDHHGARSTIDFSEATFNIPSVFIADTDVTVQTVGTINNKDSLRLKGLKKLNGWNICVDDVYKDNELVCDLSDNKLCYAIEVGDKVTSYSLCIKAKDIDNEDNEAVFTTTTLAEPSVSTLETEPESTLLSYEYESDIRKTTVPFQMLITNAANDLEFVPYNVNSATDQITAYGGVCKIDGVTPCDLTSYAKTEQDMTILIVNPENGAEGSSNVLTFKDYIIEAEYLGDSIIETSWKRGEEPAAFKTFYGASIATIADPGAVLNHVIIDCSSNNPNDDTICYAYFIGLTDPSYFVTLTPADDTVEPATELTDKLLNNQIKTEVIPKAGRQQARILDISLIPDTRYAYDVITVCYEASEGNHNRTRDEVILIDEGGHWMKIHHSTEGENHMHCFSPVDLLKSSLRITTDTKLTAVIVERELNGNKVLASGQKDIDLSALRAIKPEVDNGNNGSTSTLAIVGAVIAGIACLMALVAAAVIFVMKMNRDNDGTQYPLHRSNIEDTNVVHGLDNPIPTM